MKKKNNIAYFISIILVVLITIFFNKIDNNQISENDISQLSNDSITINIDTISFSPDNLKKVLKILDVSNPDIVYKQAYLETNGFTSNIFLENNNLFGMKHPYIRETTAIDINRGHAVYDNWIDSVKDIKLYQEYFYFIIISNDNYYDFLIDVGYAEDENYVYKLKRLNV